MKKITGKRWLTGILLAAMLTGCGKAKSDGTTPAGMESSGGNMENGMAAEDIYADVYYENDAPLAEGGNAGNRYSIAEDSFDGGYEAEYEEEFNTEEYSAQKEMGFAKASVTPLSTFSADVDTASYSNLRRMIDNGYGLEDIPAGAVRVEEILNYFDYDYRLPKDGEPFGVTTQIGDCPWQEGHKLLAIGLKSEEIDFSESGGANLVFLLDVSGSMSDSDKLPLLQRAFGMLAENLTEKDRVSIVTYAGEDQVLLEGEPGDHTEQIMEVLDSLTASGSTNGGRGIQTAYEIAGEYFIEGGNNRVILATDGDLNVGQTSESELTDLIEEKRESGVYLTVLGFGTGNIKDNKMEALADNGNGNYAYIDSVKEAKKVLVEEMGATLVTVAKDVKLQVEFNPEKVSEYRLIGYENRMLDAQDFEDDKKDAGEIGAGHTVTALYEIVPAKEGEDAEHSLKYSQTVTTGSPEWLTVNIRYKEPDGDESILLQYPVDDSSFTEEPSQDWQFAAAAAEFGLVVTDSDYKGNGSLEHVKSVLKKLDIEEDEYKDEFYDLVRRLIKMSK